MPVGIVPKSEARQFQTVVVGYGAVPVVEREGKRGWGLPGRQITYCQNQATKLAEQLDEVIRRNLNHPNRPHLI